MNKLTLKKGFIMVAIIATVGFVASAFAGWGMGGYGHGGPGWHHMGWGGPGDGSDTTRT